MVDWTLPTFIEHWRALREADAVALRLQAEKYEDRLTKLNGEHATLIKMKDTYVLREVYDRDMDRNRSERQAAIAAADEAKTRAEERDVTNRRTLMIAISGLVTALVGWGITLLVHFVPGSHGG